MLNRPRLLAITVAAVISVGILNLAEPAAADPDGPRAEYCGDSAIFGTGCLGAQDGKSPAQDSGPAYTGPTRLELALQRCEEGDYMLWGTGCKSGAFAAETLRRMLADGPGEPGVAEREVVAALRLLPPRIGMTPRPGPDSVALVGYNVWLWVDNPDPQTFGPATATANIDAWTITVTGRVESVDWDMGDGHVVRCAGPGTAYVVARDGLGPSPDCGHVYTEQGEFTVTATAHWRIDWTTSDGAQSGMFTTEQVSTVPVTVGEWQVLLKRDGGW